MKVFLGTNVLLYAAGVDRSTEKHVIAREFLSTRSQVAMSVQVLNEFVFQSTRASRPHHLPFGEAVRFTNTLRRFEIIPLDLDLFDAATTVKVKTTYSWWDSLIVAAAIVAGCDALYSEDMQHGRVIEGVWIENPFRELA